MMPRPATASRNCSGRPRPGEDEARQALPLLDPGGLGKVSSLRAFGINADIKHGSGLVVAPPSRHAEDRAFSYAWDGCDPTVIRHLPMLDVRALHDLTARSTGRGAECSPMRRGGANALPCVGQERNAPQCISTAPAPPPPYL